MKKFILLIIALAFAFGVYAQNLVQADSVWTTIKNETVRGANTAERIGNAGISIIDGVRDTLNYFASKDTLSNFVSTSDGIISTDSISVKKLLDSSNKAILGISAGNSYTFYYPNNFAPIFTATNTGFYLGNLNEEMVFQSSSTNTAIYHNGLTSLILYDDSIHINKPITATSYRVSSLNEAPASATAEGTAGEIRITADYIYVCVSDDVWVRSALVTWP